MESFSDRLVALMGERGMNQRDLSQATGISQGTISKYINKRQMPKSRELYAISKVLGVQMESWFDDAPFPTPKPKDSKPKVTLANLDTKISRLKQNAAEAAVSVEKLLAAITKLEEAL
jgi:transcriptional regulator with XRE-family HTH domain